MYDDNNMSATHQFIKFLHNYKYLIFNKNNNIYIYLLLCISGCGNGSFMSFPEMIFGLREREFLSRNKYDSWLESEHKHVPSGRDYQ